MFVGIRFYTSAPPPIFICDLNQKNNNLNLKKIPRTSLVDVRRRGLHVNQGRRRRRRGHRQRKRRIEERTFRRIVNIDIGIDVDLDVLGIGARQHQVAVRLGYWNEKEKFKKRTGVRTDLKASTTFWKTNLIKIKLNIKPTHSGIF